MKKIMLLLISALFIYSCGYQEGVVQKGEKGFIKFSGSYENTTVQINDAAPFELSTTKQGLQRDTNTIFQVMPGKHTVKVFRNGQLILNRIYLIDNNNTVEVSIP